MEWISVEDRLPEKFGWYNVKTIHGEFKVPFVNNAKQELVWVIPDPSIITHWQQKLIPCDLDHNGECLICDCWISECGYQRLLKEDYRYENKEQLMKMFNISEEELTYLKSKKNETI